MWGRYLAYLTRSRLSWSTMLKGRDRPWMVEPSTAHPWPRHEGWTWSSSGELSTSACPTPVPISPLMLVTVPCYTVLVTDCFFSKSSATNLLASSVPDWVVSPRLVYHVVDRSQMNVLVWKLELRFTHYLCKIELMNICWTFCWS